MIHQGLVKTITSVFRFCTTTIEEECQKDGESAGETLLSMCVETL
jgi:hypothetical protein